MKSSVLLAGLVCFNMSFSAQHEMPADAMRQMWERIAAHITKRNALLGYVDPEVAYIGRDPGQRKVQSVPPSNDPEIEFTGTRPH